MFVKFHQFDTSCFHIINSTNTIPNIGISVKPIKKHNNKQQPQRLSRENGVIKIHDGKPVINKTFGVKYHPKNSHIGPSQEFPIRNTNNKTDVSDTLLDCEQTLDKRIESKKINVSEKSWKRANGVVVKKVQTNCSTKWTRDSHNGRLGISDTLSGYEKNPDGDLGKKKIYVSEKTGKRVINGVKNKVQTECSTKWARYGGCIPSLLMSLKSESDLDVAFKPWEKGLNTKEMSIILKEQIKWDRAMEIFKWFKQKGCYEVNVIHYNIMLRILGKSERWKEVETLCDEMKKNKIEAINSTYGTLIDVYSKGKRKEEAMKWLELMNKKGMKPDEVTMGIIVQMYKKSGEFKKAEEYFKNWSINKKVINGACLSSYTYNNLIDTYGKAGQVNEACKTFEQMLKDKIVPTSVTFNTMIHMCGNNGKLEEVSKLMQKMKELKCLPDTRTYNILISLHIKHDNIKIAENYFNEMKGVSLKPDIVSYRTLLYAYSLRHMVNEAEKLVYEMDQTGLIIDEFTQSALTRMYIEAGMLKKSWFWFEKFHLLGNMSSDCYSANIDAFGERGYVFEAKKVFDSCKNVRKLRVLEFNVMIKAYGISKKFHEACDLFDEMENYKVVPDKCTFSSLIQMLASGDLPEKASFYVRKMYEFGLVNDCIPYCAVISSFVKLGKLKMAEDFYKEMIKVGVKADIIVYGVLINAFAEIGSVKEGLIYLDAIKNEGLLMNGIVYNSLIKLYTKVGYLKEAYEAYIKRNELYGLDIYSSNCMIDLYSERSMIKQAEEIFEKLIKNGKANEFSYAMMLCMYKRNGRFEEGYKIGKKMREDGILKDVLSYNNLLHLYACDGRYREASLTFKEMLRNGILPDEATFKSLGIVLMKCGLSREVVVELEVLRKDDCEKGVCAWKSTLCSVIDV